MRDFVNNFDHNFGNKFASNFVNKDQGPGLRDKEPEGTDQGQITRNGSRAETTGQGSRARAKTRDQGPESKDQALAPRD